MRAQTTALPAVPCVEPLPRCDPERAALALQGRPGLAWLDGHGAARDGRFSFVGCDPVHVQRVPFGRRAPLERLAALDPQRDAPVHRAAASPADRAPRWIGYVGYDATWSGADGVHRVPGWAGQPRIGAQRTRDGRVPVLWFGRYDAIAAFDHVSGRAWLVGDDAGACTRLRRRLERGTDAVPRARVAAAHAAPRDHHERAIGTALEHIAAGEIYQVNLARRWTAPFEGSPLALWLQMRRASPVPLGLFLDGGDHAVLARTMERFIAWDGPGGRLSTRPIKGTIARAGDDRTEAQRLRCDEKERAEHTMIVDLMRNDLGRIAQTGSVEVREPLTVEPYAKLSHLVSTVTCTTREDVQLGDVFAATFPPGSVTGAPKVRAVEIIEQLERSPRDIYTGCVGYVGRDGSASFAVAIRTAAVAGPEVRYHAGGGLVEASIPQKEIAETELKARVFLDALRGLS